MFDWPVAIDRLMALDTEQTCRDNRSLPLGADEFCAAGIISGVGTKQRRTSAPSLENEHAELHFGD